MVWAPRGCVCVCGPTFCEPGQEVVCSRIVVLSPLLHRQGESTQHACVTCVKFRARQPRGHVQTLVIKSSRWFSGLEAAGPRAREWASKDEGFELSMWPAHV